MADRVITMLDGTIASDIRNSERKAPAEITW
jgi:hypothetical protein